MERDVNLKRREIEITTRLKELGFGGFISTISEEKLLRRYEPMFRDALGADRRYQLSSIWFCESIYSSGEQTPRISITFNTYGMRIDYLKYDSMECGTRVERGDTIKYGMDNNQLALVLNALQAIAWEREEEVAKTSSNPPIESLYDDIQNAANRILASNGEYTAAFETGKRNMDKDAYECLVIRTKRGGYAGSIVFGRNKFGEYSMTTRVPLCGESSSPFTLETLNDVLRKEIEFIIS